MKSEAVLKAMNDGTLTLKIGFLDAAKEPCLVEVIDAENTIRLKGHLENMGSDYWLEKVVTLFPTTELEASVSGKTRYGTQDFAITNVTFFNADKNEAHVFEVGSKMHIKLDFQSFLASNSDSAVKLESNSDLSIPTLSIFFDIPRPICPTPITDTL